MDKRSIGFGFFGKTKARRKTRTASEQAEMQAKVAIKGNRTHVWGEGDGRPSLETYVAQSRTQSMPVVPVEVASTSTRLHTTAAEAQSATEDRHLSAPAELAPPLMRDPASLLPTAPSAATDPIQRDLLNQPHSPPAAEATAAEPITPPSSNQQQTIRKQFSFCPSTLSVRELPSATSLGSLRGYGTTLPQRGSMRSLSTSSSGLDTSPAYPRHSAAYLASRSHTSLLPRSRSYGSDRKFQAGCSPTRHSSTSLSIVSDHHVSIHGDEDEHRSDLSVLGLSPRDSLHYSHSFISRGSFEQTAFGSQIGSTSSLDLQPYDRMAGQIYTPAIPNALRSTIPVVAPAPDRVFRPGTFNADEYECGDEDDLSSVSGLSVFSSLSESDEISTATPLASSDASMMQEPAHELTSHVHPGLRRGSVKRSMRVSYLENGHGGYIVERRHRKRASSPPSILTDSATLATAHATDDGPYGAGRSSLEGCQSPVDPIELALAEKVQSLGALLPGSPSCADGTGTVQEASESGEWIVEREYIPCGVI